MGAALDWAIVILVGAAVGTTELLSRYRDAPGRAVASSGGIAYVLLNASASALALALIRVFGWTFGASDGGTSASVRWTQVMVAAFGSMALFRSALFTVRVGDQDVAVGPSSILQIVLATADRTVDRVRARARSIAVSNIMRGISFEKAHAALPAYCLALLQNPSAQDQEELARQIAALRDASMDDDVKGLLLGLALLNVVGEGVLMAAVETLRQDLSDQ
jgi:hypothetical protein